MTLKDGARVTLSRPARFEFGEHVMDIRLPDGLSAGQISFRNLDRRLAQAELGIEVYEPYRGRGLGPDAIRLLLRDLFDNWNLERVYLRVREYNARARRAYEKVGFRYVKTVRWPLIGVVRYLVMEITKAEFTWRPAPS